MRCAGGDFNCASLLNCADGLNERSCGVNLIVNDHDTLPLHVTDDVEDFCVIIIPFASLLNDCERRVE